MKKLTWLVLLCTIWVSAQTPDQITTGVKQVVTDKVKGLSDAELKMLVERFNAANKEIKDAKDFSVETNVLDKTEFDTLTTLKRNNIHQLKIETEGNYFVIKYIDRDKDINDFIKLRNVYKEILKDGKNAGETTEAYKARIKAAYDAKNKANPFKICYRYLLNCDNNLRKITTTTFSKYSLNLVTVPFKIFPAGENGAGSQVNGDIDNVGLYTTLRLIDWSTLNSKGTATERSFGVGFYIAPSVVKLDKNNSEITDESEVNKIYLTTALAFHIKYGKFTVMLIPAGVDTATSKSAKSWNYDGKYWWGFGLGVDTSLFNF